MLKKKILLVIGVRVPTRSTEKQKMTLKLHLKVDLIQKIRKRIKCRKKRKFLL
jgi:hypothetical protein